jgi:Holliday junction resolvase RusA-like endonuclease
MEQFMDVILDMESATWGNRDKDKRKALREELKKHIPNFSSGNVENFVSRCSEIEVSIDCYLINPDSKDIDNLAKIPIDAIFFSAANEIGYKTWERKILFLSIRKRQSTENKLSITILGKHNGSNSSAFSQTIK